MITRRDVEALLRSRAVDPVLVVSEGRAAVVPRAEQRGAAEVVSRDALVGRLGGSAEDVAAREDLDELASRLDATITELGG